MNINYNSKDNFFSNPFEDDSITNDPFDIESIKENTQQGEQHLISENPLEENKTLHLVGVPLHLQGDKEEFKNVERKFSYDMIDAKQENLVEDPSLFEKSVDRKKLTYSDKLGEQSDEVDEENETIQFESDDILNDHYFGVAINLEKINEGKDRVSKVKLFDLKRPDLYNPDQLEEAQKVHKAGMGILIPKSGKGPFLAQENIAPILKKYDISEVEVMNMPEGTPRVFKGVRFQTITGSTSVQLSQAFEQLTTVIFYARLELEKEERRKREQELIEANQYQSNPSLHAILNKRNDRENKENKPENKIIFQFCFKVINDPNWKRIEDSKKISEQRKEERTEERLEETAKIKKRKSIKSDIEKQDIQVRGIDDETKKKSEGSLETKKREIGMKIKEKVKLHPASDPDAPPIDIIDITREKRPI